MKLKKTMKPEALKSTDRYYPVGAGRFCCAENQPLFHTNSNSFLIMYIVDGAFTFVKNGMQISAHVGDMLYCDNPSNLQSDMNSRGELIWMQIGGADCFELIQKNKGITKCKNTASEKKLFLHIYDSICNSSKPFSKLNICTDIEKLLQKSFCFNNSEDCTENETNDSIQKVLNYIADNLNENLSVRNLADKIPMSVSHFNRVFKKYTGDSPYAYVMKMRIKKAEYLLRSTELTITAVAYETGFNSEANFIYVFTKNVGVSPGKFRKLKKENAV